MNREQEIIYLLRLLEDGQFTYKCGLPGQNGVHIIEVGGYKFLCIKDGKLRVWVDNNDLGGIDEHERLLAAFDDIIDSAMLKSGN